MTRNKPTGQIEQALRLFEGRWTARILCVLLDGKLRYGAIRERVEGVTDRVLSTRLKELEQRGLVARKTVGARPPEVWYCLTASAEALKPIFDAMGRWKAPRR
jgi:DNA-binding HxlR family transcriptional regulator